MLINNTNNNNKHITFVSYTGKWPNLCTGILILKIDGEQVSFGNQKECDYPKFWSTGGSCGFTNGYSSSYINKGEWIID
jgi:hypothetical protein